jgi:hypothetical protein
MQPVYDGHGLTNQEQVDLAAFLATTAGEDPGGDATWLFVALGICVALGAVGLMFLVWPRRRLVVRRRIAPSPSPRRH